MSEKSAVWKTMPLATAVVIAIDKRQGVLIEDELIKILSNEERLKGVEKISQDWEGDVTEWEYWEKELEEWKMRLEDILMKS